MTAAEDRTRLIAGDVTSVRLVTEALDQIEADQPRINAYTHVARQLAIDAAQKIDDDRAAGRPVGVLAGLPVAVKDIFTTADMPTTCSSAMLRDYRAPTDAFAVAKIRAAGGVIVGKTNLDEFAMGASTETSAFGPTRNPIDPTLTPGGSSGGAAATVAAGHVGLSIGTDTGGSIRQPAAFCGVCGFKPTYGRVSRRGMIAFSSSLDTGGPIAATCDDLGILLTAMVGHDPADSTSINAVVDEFTRGVTPEDLTQLRVGVLRESIDHPALDNSIRGAVEKSLSELTDAGATLVDISLPTSPYWVPAYYVIAPCEASSNLSRYDGAHYGHRAVGEDGEPIDDLLTMYRRSRAEGFGREVKRRIMLGTFALSAGYVDAFYNQALRVRRLIRQDFDRAFEKVDVLIGPTTPTPPFAIGTKIDDPIAMYLCDLFTVGANLAGIPAMSLPAGVDAAGRPLAIQLQAPAMQDARLLRIGAALEQLLPWRRPARTPPAPPHP